jgi:mannose-6-phosphate isomerase class I
MSTLRTLVEKALTEYNGILPLEPAWVARDFLPPGGRLGCPEELYDLAERGGVGERWLASTTEADNRIKVANEGLSFLSLQGKERMTLKDAVAAAPDLIMGREYARTHPRGLDRLAKIFDYEYRIPYHLHPMKRHAELVGRNPKEEAYYFPEGVSLGNEPETYMGVHPSISEQKQYDILLPYLEQWNSDLILRHSRAYKLVPGDGWHVPAGILHAPGTALTVELQEDSDVFAMLQAKVGNRILSKDLLFKDVRLEDREKYGEKFILEMIDWEANGDPYFFENHHTPPVPIRKSAEGEEEWIFYNTKKFSGKRLVVRPGKTMTTRDAGVYSLFVWRGRGTFDGHDMESGKKGLDELLVSHSKAVENLAVKNTGSEDLVILKFFGPDVCPDAPMLKPYGKGQ